MTLSVNEDVMNDKNKKKTEEDLASYIRDNFFTRVLTYLLPGVCIYSLEHLKDLCFFRGLEPRTLCMAAGRNANQYTRADYTNNNEILSITISEQIFEA